MDSGGKDKQNVPPESEAPAGESSGAEQPPSSPAVRRMSLAPRKAAESMRNSLRAVVDPEEHFSQDLESPSFPEGTIGPKRGKGAKNMYGEKEAFLMSELFKMEEDVFAGDYRPVAFERPSDIQSIDEPSEGMEPSNFNVEQYKRARSGCQFYDFTPTRYTKQLPELRHPQRIPPNERITVYEELISGRNPAEVTFVYIQNRTDINHTFLCRQLSAFPRVEILFLRNLGLQHVHDISLPSLRYLDLTGNRIADPRTVQSMIARSPNLETLIITENPILQNDQWRSMVVAANTNLKTINGQIVSIDDKSAAIEKHGTQEQKARHPHWRWDWIMNIVCEKLGMQKWQPDRIQRLPLSSLKLQMAHVGTLVNLQSLELSNNNLTGLEGMGLERLEQLKKLDVSNNKISRPEALSVLAYIPRLQNVVFEGNPLPDYRLRIAFVTLNLRGTNRCLGLEQVDSKPLTIDEKCHSMAVFGRVSQDQLEVARWNYVLILVYGHKQLRTISQFHSRLRSMRINRVGLAFADVSSFVGLELLDLSDNNLSSVSDAKCPISGLERLQKLRYLNLANNPDLVYPPLLAALQSTGSLEAIVLSPDEVLNNPARAAHVATFRRACLESLLSHHERLRAFDNQPITIAERIQSLKAHKVPDKQVEAYRFQVGCLISSTVPVGRSYGLEHVTPGSQYDPNLVTMLQLANLSLSSCDLRPFKNLEKLDLHNNQLTDLIGTGISECAKLEMLDVSFNLIKMDVDKLAAFLDSMSELQFFAIRGNPCMPERPSREHDRLLAAIQRMKTTDVERSLKVVETLVTVDDRMTVWRKSGASDDMMKDLRFRAAAFLRTPKGYAPQHVTHLDLNSFGLTVVRFENYVNLETLLLRDNEIATIADAGLEKCTNLQCLDLRDNRIREMREVTTLVNGLLKIEAVGLAGNPFAKNRKYRFEFLQPILRLRQVECPLYELDEQPITIDEIIEAWRLDKPSDIVLDKFRFDYVMHRKCGSQPANEIKELNLAGFKLSVLSFAPYSGLKKLSLRKNKITAADLSVAQLELCAELEALDVAENFVDDLQRLAEIVEKLPNLKVLYADKTPCFPNDDKRLEFLSKLPQMQKRKASLQHLNGSPISIFERCKAMSSVMKKAEVEKLRFELTVDEAGLTAESVDALLPERGLVDISGLAREFPNITNLDLRGNNITTIKGSGLRNLPNLQFLDLRHNALQNFDDTFEELRHCKKLKFLFLEGAGEGMAEKIDYAVEVFKAMRSLEFLDNLKHPFPMTAEQLQAASYLEQKFGISPNNLNAINLSRAGLTMAQFWSVLSALATLVTIKRKTVVETQQQGTVNMGSMIGPESLKLISPKDEKIKNFNGQPVPEYRFLLVYNIPSLTNLDDHEVSLDEHENAERAIEEIRLSLKKKQAEEKKMQLYKGDRLTVAAVNRSEKMAMSVGQGAGAGAGAGVVLSTFNVSFDFIEQNAGNMAIVSELKSALKMRMYNVESLGTVLSKLEILLNYAQIFAIVFSFPVTWPVFWVDILSWVTWFSFDFEFLLPTFALPMQYVKFFAIMAAPAIAFSLYFVQFNKEKWHKAYVDNWSRTLSKYFSIWLVCLIPSAIAAILSDWETILRWARREPVPTNMTISVFIGLMAFATVVLFFFFCNAMLFRRHKDDKQFWVKFFYRYRQKLALFMITVMYMPVARTILVSFKCDANGKHLAYFSDQLCPTGASDVPAMWIVSIILAVAYILGIPFFFFRLITQGSTVIEVDYSMHVDDEELKEYNKQLSTAKDEFKKLKKEGAPQETLNENKMVVDMLEKKAKEKKEFIQNKYANAVNTYKSASTYLYSSYERRMKYYKIFQMTEKLVLLVLALYAANEQQSAKTAACSFVIGAYFLVGAIFRPFGDNMEDISDTLSRLVNTLNGVFGYLLARNFIIPTWFVMDWALVGINGLNIAVVLGNFLGQPIRYLLRLREVQKQMSALGKAGDKAIDVVASSGVANKAAEAANELEEEIDELEAEMPDFDADLEIDVDDLPSGIGGIGLPTPKMSLNVPEGVDTQHASQAARESLGSAAHAGRESLGNAGAGAQEGASRSEGISVSRPERSMSLSGGDFDFHVGDSSSQAMLGVDLDLPSAHELQALEAIAQNAPDVEKPGDIDVVKLELDVPEPSDLEVNLDDVKDFGGDVLNAVKGMSSGLVHQGELGAAIGSSDMPRFGSGVGVGIGVGSIADAIENAPEDVADYARTHSSQAVLAGAALGQAGLEVKANRDAKNLQARIESDQKRQARERQQLFGIAPSAPNQDSESDEEEVRSRRQRRSIKR